ncbi:hypothetical protein RRG08_062360 [Elysia crispata]|uniref:Uncharacterized protein n=1 Tax=Elysia crispata TaxID=231223 RepID=A0AAE1CY47_9GAST|nr:hypothetical protein RRG08_062360 [Elysia crispata]
MSVRGERSSRGDKAVQSNESMGDNEKLNMFVTQRVTDTMRDSPVLVYRGGTRMVRLRDTVHDCVENPAMAGNILH